MAQRTLFDLETIKEIIVNSPYTPSAENVVKIRDFFSSASFAFNAQISRALLDNGRLIVEAAEDRRKTYSLLHENYSRLIDPKFEVDVAINNKFMLDLLTVQAAEIRRIAELAPLALNVNQFRNLDETYDASTLYYYCLQSLAVGAEAENNCLEKFKNVVTTNVGISAGLETSYMIAYRISRLMFTRYHPELKYSRAHSGRFFIWTLIHEPADRRSQIDGITVDEFKDMRIIESKEIEITTECTDLRAALNSLKSIRDSQARCHNPEFMGGLFCGKLQTEENRRKIIVPFDSQLVSPGAPIYIDYARENKPVSRTSRMFEVDSVCPRKPRTIN